MYGKGAFVLPLRAFGAAGDVAGGALQVPWAAGLGAAYHGGVRPAMWAGKKMLGSAGATAGKWGKGVYDWAAKEPLGRGLGMAFSVPMIGKYLSDVGSTISTGVPASLRQ